jgi:hypothetical protein
MKKMALVALLAVGGFALAASINCPWFVDNAAVNSGLNQTASGAVLALIGVHNNTSGVIEARIDYYAADGTYLDYNGGTETEITTRLHVWSPTYNTFLIDPNSTIQWRPVADDPNATATPLGQESSSGVLVPNRPRYTSATNFEKKTNGACVVTWVPQTPLGALELQGRYQEWGVGMTASFLLPGGG